MVHSILLHFGLQQSSGFSFNSHIANHTLTHTRTHLSMHFNFKSHLTWIQIQIYMDLSENLHLLGLCTINGCRQIEFINLQFEWNDL